MVLSKLRLLLILTILFVGYNYAESAHFTYANDSCTGSILNEIIVIQMDSLKIGNVKLSPGDEIGVFDSLGNCWGFSDWDSVSNKAIAVFGYMPPDEGLGIPRIPGMPPAGTMSFRIWDSSASKEYSIVAVVLKSGNLQFNTEVPFLVVNTLTALLVPDKPNITNPLNNAVYVALSGNLTWDSAAGATKYHYTLSANSDFSSPILNDSSTNRSIAYSNLSYGTTYYLRVRGSNNVGYGDYATSTFQTKLAQVVLTTPANNSKNIALTGTLNWNTISNATSYDVQIATDVSFNNIITNTNVSSNSYNYTVPNNLTTYYWKVRAKNGSNYGDYSSVFQFETKLASPVINYPTNNAGGIPTTGTITWNSVTGAVNYTIQISSDDAFNTLLTNEVIAGTTYDYSSLNNYTYYYVRVKASNADGESNYTTHTFRTVVGTPTNLIPTTNTYSQHLAGTLQWQSVLGASNYEIQVSTNSTFTNIVASSTTLTTNSYNYTGLVNATKYYWRVRAKNTEGTGLYSTISEFTTLIAAPTLVSPANNATNINSVTGTLTWTAPSTSTLHRVQIATDAAFNNIVVNQNDITTTSYTYSNLQGMTAYYWRVYSYNANNSGTWAAPFKFTTGLSKVILASPTNNTAGQPINGVNLTWNTLNGATTYRVIVSENSDLSSPIQNVTGVTNTSYTLNGLAYNKTYYWGVKGQNANGDGPQSDIWSFGTKVDKPTLLTPANNAVDVALTGSMTWSAPAGATSYQIQVSLANDFATTVVDASDLTNTNYSYTNLANNTTHYWRVRGYKNGQPGEWSNVFTFKTIQLLPPVLVSPTNNKIDVFFDVTLDWNSALNATAYDVQLATDAAFTNIVDSATDITLTELEVTGLFYQTKYYWRVRSKNDIGSSTWSTVYSFTTIKTADFTGNMTVCENDEVMYSTDASAVIDYNWSVIDGTIIGSSTTKDVVVKWTTAGTGILKLIRTSAEWGTYTDSVIKNITVNPKVDVAVTITPNTYYPNKICVKESVEYSATFDQEGINQWIWRYNGNIIGNEEVLTYKFDNAGTYTITLEVFGTDCKNGLGSYDVVVTEDCPVTILADSVFTCKNSSPTLYADVFGGSGSYNIAWTPETEFVDATVEDATLKNAVVSNSYTITATDINEDLTANKIVYVIVRQSPWVGFSKLFHIVRNPDAIDITDPSILTVTVTGGTAPYEFLWKNNSRQPIDPTVVYPNLGINYYWLTVNDDNSCGSIEKRFSVIRYASKDIFDNATPGINGTGYAVTFPNPATDYVNVFSEFGEETYVNLKVFNTLGEMVYSSQHAETKQFQGQLDVTKLPVGTYTVVLETFNDTIISRFIKR